MKKLILLLAILPGLIACQQKKQKDDPEHIKAVLIDFFNGIKTKDFQKIKDITTSDFLLFEDGQVYNTDGFITTLKNFPKFSVEYTFDNFKIFIDDSSGNMSYFNHGEFVFNDTTHMTANWLESATFKKVENKWKLDFLHSTVRK